MDEDGVVRWRCADLRAEAIQRFAVDVTERTFGKWLRYGSAHLFGADARCKAWSWLANDPTRIHSISNQD